VVVARTGLRMIQINESALRISVFDCPQRIFAQRRKLPILIGIGIQMLALSLLLYSSPVNSTLDIALCFLFGLGNSAHMLAFSTVGDVVEPDRIGTSAAIVNGMMFIVGGIMISRPGVRIGLGLEAGVVPRSLELAQFASRPLLIGIAAAFVIALLMRETYPARSLKPGPSTAVPHEID